MSASLPPNDALDPAMQEGLRALRASTEASPADVARLSERLAAAPPPMAPRWPLAVAPLLLLVGGLGLWLADRPLDPSDVVLTETGLTLAGERLALTEGSGTARLDGDRVRVDWVVGTIEAEPTASQQLLVATPEAEWTVAGPGSLERDRLGTHVGGAEDAVCLGERVADTCLPLHAAGWLGRAHALVGQGDLSLAADAFDAARELAAEDAAVRAEASAGLAEVLVRSGEMAEGASAAEQALADVPGTREMRLHMLAARAYLTLGDCGAALPHLRALPEPTAQEAAYIERCETQLRSPE